MSRRITSHGLRCTGEDDVGTFIATPLCLNYLKHFGSLYIRTESYWCVILLHNAG